MRFLRSDLQERAKLSRASAGTPDEMLVPFGPAFALGRAEEIPIADGAVPSLEFCLLSTEPLEADSALPQSDRRQLCFPIHAPSFFSNTPAKGINEEGNLSVGAIRPLCRS